MASISNTTTTTTTTTTKNNNNERGRNWTKEETELFVSVLSDPNDDYAAILEKKALKKGSNKLHFEDIMAVFNEALADPDFIAANERSNFSRKGKVVQYNKLVFEGDGGIKKLQSKYKDLKGKWRRVTDAARNGWGEEGATDERWYQLLNPILSETNGDLSEVVNGALDTSFGESFGENGVETGADEEDVDDDILINDLLDGVPPAKKKKKDLAKKPKLQVKSVTKKNPVIRTQTQGLAALGNSVRAFGEQQSSRFQKETEETRKRDENFLKFKAEQRELDRQHELKIFEMMLQYQYGRNAAPPQSQSTVAPSLPYLNLASSQPLFPQTSTPRDRSEIINGNISTATQPCSYSPLVALSASQTPQTSVQETGTYRGNTSYAKGNNYPAFANQNFF